MLKLEIFFFFQYVVLIVFFNSSLSRPKNLNIIAIGERIKKNKINDITKTNLDIKNLLTKIILEPKHFINLLCEFNSNHYSFFNIDQRLKFL